MPEGEAGFEVGDGVLHDACHGLVGVASALVDFEARVATEESVEVELYGRVGGVGSLLLVFERGVHVHAACRADNHFAFRFVVEVQENFTFDDIGLHVVHAVHRSLLVGRDEALDGTMLQRVVLHDGHDGSHGHAVVGTERGALGAHPFTVDVGLDGVSFKVVVAVSGLLRHHVHVALERHALAVLHAWRGSLAHDDVSGLVLEGLDTLLLGPVEEEALYLFEVSRGARHLREKVKVFPDFLRMQVSNFAHVCKVLGVKV